MSFLDKIVARSIENERALVDDPQRARRMLLRDVAIFVVALVCLVGRDWLDAHPVAYLLASCFVGWVVGLGALSATRRASSYRSGWLAGRSQMISAMLEAQRRDLDASQWLQGELDRDAHLLGLHLMHDDSDDET